MLFRSGVAIVELVLGGGRGFGRQRGEHGLFGWEIVEQGTAGDPGGVGDVARGGVIEAVGREQLPRGVENILPGPGLGLSRYANGAPRLTNMTTLIL